MRWSFVPVGHLYPLVINRVGHSPSWSVEIGHMWVGHAGFGHSRVGPSVGTPILIIL
jgi:hypothetical protein